MKTLIFVFLIVTILFYNGCAPVIKVQPDYKPMQIFDYSIDITKYGGFFISFRDYLGRHETVGIFEISMYPAQFIVKDSVPGFEAGLNKYSYEYEMYPEIIYGDEMFDSLYSVAKRHGADGVSRVEIKKEDFGEYPIYKIKGLAIKRLSK